MTKAHHLAALEALADVANAATATGIAASEKHSDELAASAARIHAMADAARTRLVQDGDEYLPVAWAVLDTCRISLAETRLRVSNARGRRYAVSYAS